MANVKFRLLFRAEVGRKCKKQTSKKGVLLRKQDFFKFGGWKGSEELGIMSHSYKNGGEYRILVGDNEPGPVSR